MASGPEHYTHAENHLYAYEVNGSAVALEKAKVHATLALAAATAFNRGEHGTPTAGWAIATQQAKTERQADYG